LEWEKGTVFLAVGFMGFVGAFKALLHFDELFKKNDSFCKKF
jgi:hypothetical protein